MMSSSGSNGGGGGGGSGPCGACKFLRRKCVKGCIFAPYFDSEQGATHFAAVHKVFGASNVSKLLLRLPLHKRLDAVVTICYEALARIRDPVYGCVAHIFALQQQVVNLQAELAFVQAHLSTLEIPTSQAMSSAHHPQQQHQRQEQSPSPPLMVHNSNSIQQHVVCSSMMSSTTTRATSSSTNLSSTQFTSLQSQQTMESPSCCGPTHDHQQHFDDGELQALAREYVSRYFPEVKYQKSSSSY